MYLEITLLNTIDPLWDQNLMHLFEGIKVELPKGNLAILAKQIAAIFSLLYLAFKSYVMISGDGRLDILSLFRPFLFAMAIINFNLVSTIFGLPGEVATSMTGDNFVQNVVQVDEHFDEKRKLSDSLFVMLLHNVREIAGGLTNVAKTGSLDGDEETLMHKGLNIMSGGTLEIYENLEAYLTIFEQLAFAKISLWFQGIIEYLTIAVFKGICYCIFFLQLIIMAVLLWIGPISFAFSIMGPFRNSWSHWAGKYISVSFYSAIGYFILNLSFAILDYGTNQEIERLRGILDAGQSNVERFFSMVLHIDSFLPFLFISIIVAVAGVIATPIVSTWFIESAGTGGAMFKGALNTAKGAATGGMGVAKKAVGL